MGIKGIYGEIGPGERIALSKLAVEKYEETGRPLRIAVDAAIWQFQIQAGRGGTDPSIRTFYYRLLRLLATTIQPLFVFDGPHKPPVKRNKRTGTGGSGASSNLGIKQLLKHFGFPYHYAPGEAEAECALLQQNGIVDAVLSEDVDTLMFGSGLCLRNWSSEGSRNNKAPTHVSAYDKKIVSEKYGLDREGMILVAMMSGGDYKTEGIPGCGIKLACEAARAGFGKSLLQISRSDTLAYKCWREKLAHEINTNDGRLFKTKHKMFKIPENFPDREVLGYYTHPVVSNHAKILKLKHEIHWDGVVDVSGLRQFVAEAFEWKYKSGAIRFIRGLAPAILVHKLRLRGESVENDFDDLILTAMNETDIVRNICGRRKHFSTDGILELRLIYHPLDIVGLNLEMENEEPIDEFGRDGLALHNSEDTFEDDLSLDDGLDQIERSTKSSSTSYDPNKLEKIWVARTIARIGVPLKVEDYEEALRSPEKFLRAKTVSKRVIAKSKDVPRRALDRVIKVPNSGKISQVQSKITSQKLSFPSFQSESHSEDHVDSEKRLDPRSGKGIMTDNSPKLMKSVGKPKINSHGSKNSTTKIKPNPQKTGKVRSNAVANQAFSQVTKINCSHVEKSTSIDSFKLPPSLGSSPLPFVALISPKNQRLSVSSIESFERSDKIHDPSIFNITETKNIDDKFLKLRSHLSQKEANSTTRQSNSQNSCHHDGVSLNKNDALDPYSTSDVTLSSQLLKDSSKNKSSPELLETCDLLPTREKTTLKVASVYNTQSIHHQIDITCSPSPVKSQISDDKNSCLPKSRWKIPLSEGEAFLENHITKEKVTVTLTNSDSRTTSSTSRRTQKKAIILRESLPGSWKIIDDNPDSENPQAFNSVERIYSMHEKSKRARWRISEVEILDLSAE